MAKVCSGLFLPFATREDTVYSSEVTLPTRSTDHLSTDTWLVITKKEYCTLSSLHQRSEARQRDSTLTRKQNQLSHLPQPGLQDTGLLLLFGCCVKAGDKMGKRLGLNLINLSHLFLHSAPKYVLPWVVTDYFITESWNEKGFRMTKPRSRKERILLLGLEPQQRPCPLRVRGSPPVLRRLLPCFSRLSMSGAAWLHEPTEWTLWQGMCLQLSRGWLLLCCRHSGPDGLFWLLFSVSFSVLKSGSRKFCFPGIARHFELRTLSTRWQDRAPLQRSRARSWMFTVQRPRIPWVSSFPSIKGGRLRGLWICRLFQQ